MDECASLDLNVNNLNTSTSNEEENESQINNFDNVNDRIDHFKSLNLSNQLNTTNKINISSKKHSKFFKKIFSFNKRPGISFIPFTHDVYSTGKPRNYLYKLQHIGSLKLASWISDDNTIDELLQNNKNRMKREGAALRRHKHQGGDITIIRDHNNEANIEAK